MSELDEKYETSLKSIETENFIDRIFYRPIGFRMACMLLRTRVTPNVVTVVSIFVGASAGYFFHYPDIINNVYGILLLVSANILDCTDGQLARLSGRKSSIGRILDGIAGDVWFISVYVGLAYRLSMQCGSNWFYAVAVVSGLSHLAQAYITDYYKTLHLYFISKEKGSEFQSIEQVSARHKAMRPGIYKVFYLLYRFYTLMQVKATPSLQRMLGLLSARYGDEIPGEVRIDFRRRSSRLMSYINLMTFNGRSIVLFIVLFTGYVWVYFVYEIVFLNVILAFTIVKHEKMCATFL
ncbi:MAG: CDP-alcohol phosphatidyltransferase family protein [Tannerellaceae bacterium]|jgi:phosphatidylglycerophosphate synthase|nr:CDP-alcohol phosphatidyltransferase family protein [Tannerellaceae bacterium]